MTHDKTLKGERLALWGALAWLLVSVSSCSKNEAQAPAKEAPSVQPGSEQAAQQPAVVAAAPPPAEALAADDKWPQAEGSSPVAESKGEGVGAGGVFLSEKRAKRKEAPPAAHSPAAAPKKTASGRAASDESERDSEEAAPTLSLQESVTQLDVAFDQLETALELSVPDCSSADRFRQNVCTLAEHICSLEQGLPTTVERKCTDGRRRCSQATERYKAKCTP